MPESEAIPWKRLSAAGRLSGTRNFKLLCLEMIPNLYHSISRECGYFDGKMMDLGKLPSIFGTRLSQPPDNAQNICASTSAFGVYVDALCQTGGFHQYDWGVGVGLRLMN